MNLYNKYRPQDFNTVFGQKNVVQILKNSIKYDKIAHAYIFTGPRGTGKTTIARILSKAINCTGENKPCLQCANCQSFIDGNFLDIVEIDGASNRKIEDVRELIDKAKYLPQQGRKKIYIIDEVHALTKDAFNALLKIIEEPPTHVIFILATTDVHKVLPTILSRCQRFDFKLISLDDLADKLSYILEQEKVEFDREALLKIAQLAQGGARNAEVILQQLLSGLEGRLTLERVEFFFGLGNEDKIDQFLTNLKEEQQDEALAIVKDIFLNGESLDSFYNFILEKLRDNLLNKENTLFSQDQILVIIKILAKNHKEVFSTHFPSLFLELSVVEIVNFLAGKQAINIDTNEKPVLENKINTNNNLNNSSNNITNSFERQTEISKPTSNYSAPIKPIISQKEIKTNPKLEKLIKDNLGMSLAEFRKKWLKVIISLSFRLKASVKTGKLINIENQNELTFKYAEWLKETINKEKNIQSVNEKLKKVFGKELLFKPVFGEIEEKVEITEIKPKTVLEKLSTLVIKKEIPEKNDRNTVGVLLGGTLSETQAGVKILSEIKKKESKEKINTVSRADLPKNPNLIHSAEEVADFLGGKIVE